MEGNGHSASAIPDKNLFRIGEVSRLTATKQFVLRYWETEFPMLQPVKSPKGHRLYRREDIDTVLRIKRLLYDEGFTIAGARRHLREQSSEQAGGRSAEHSDSNRDSTSDAFSEEEPAGQHSMRPAKEAPAILNRKMLLDLRDSLRSFLTLLERE
jgi:DNA-binding transcriptional MerR regulator